MSGQNGVALDGNGINIGGQYKILLCASLFYFRIPKDLWHDRIRKIKRAGYNCADVYFPWNHHELSPGEWDFSGEKDAEEFLRLLAAEGMYVVARPGPYICSEWDGGGIPAWILAGAGPVREASEDFLGKAGEWYSRILPVIARHQLGKGGTVILVQLDNELDFFDCPDPEAYMSALGRMAREFGIAAPVFGCAGQGSAERATGFADGIETAFNFYPARGDRSFDGVCHTVYKRLMELGKPLLVTETGRESFLLRRELAYGAKLVGPYNQVAGTNFGFTGGVNNWGKGEIPLSLITSDYNFDSLVSPAGEYGGEALEARLLSGLVSSLGEAFAAAGSRVDHGFEISADFTGPEMGFAALELKGGGWLLCLPNFGETAGDAAITGHGASFRAVVPAREAPFFPVGVPLEGFGLRGRLDWASAEIAHIYRRELSVDFIFCTDGDGQAVFSLPGCKLPGGGGPEDGRLALRGPGSSCTVVQGDKTIRIYIMDREKAARLEPDLSEWSAPVPSPRKRAAFAGAVSVAREPGLWSRETGRVKLGPLEGYGMWRGFGYYRLNASPGAAVLLKGVADIVAAYEGDVFAGARVSGGQWQRFACGKTGESGFRVEIWGHSNFDDPRLASMLLKSSRGILRAYEVVQEEDITGGWAFDYFEASPVRKLAEPLNGFEPLLSLNSWNTTRIPAKMLYRKKVLPKHGCGGLVLHFLGTGAYAEVYANGKKAAVLNPLDPYVDLSDSITPGKEIELAVAAVKKDWSEPVGAPTLLHCRRLEECRVSLLPEGDIPGAVGVKCEPAEFPVAFKPGEVSVLALDLDKMARGCAYARLSGSDVKVTAVFNGRIVGRILLDVNMRPFLAGGDPDRFYLPGPWFKSAGNSLRLLVEATGGSPSVTGLYLEYVETSG